MKLLLVGVTVALVAGCGGGGGDTPELAPAAVRDAPARVRDAGTFTFEAAYVRQVEGKPDETYLELEGAVDVVRSAGWMEADFSGLFAGAPPSAVPEELAQPVRIGWTRDEVSAELAGRQATVPRGRARGGDLVGRFPDEPEGLVELLAHAEEIRRVGEDETGGHDVVRFACSVTSARATEAGVPAELAAATPGKLYGPRLPLEVWLDTDGLPRRIELRIDLLATGSPGRPGLPARVVRGTYELSDFGEPVGFG